MDDNTSLLVSLAIVCIGITLMVLVNVLSHQNRITNVMKNGTPLAQCLYVADEDSICYEEGE